MKSKKILMVSLVPFWHRQTGAQQRIFSLVEALQQEGHHIKTFFPIRGSAIDPDLINRYGLDVEKHTPEMPPDGLVPKATWYCRAVLNKLLTLLRSLPYPIRQFPDRAAGMKLADYRWPWARSAFERTIKRFQPDIIVCQYVTTAWMLDGIASTQRHDIHCIIDTHDLLSARNEQFERHGHGHWIDISPEEEACVLAKFDTVLAIQQTEAAEMQAMAPNTRVVVVGHHTGDCEIVTRKRVNDSTEVKLSLGYIASVNASNTDAIEKFLEQAWPQIARDGMTELVIAGGICEPIAKKVEQLNLHHAGRVRLWGTVDDLTDFYQEIDVVINPVQFGTGLKVKTVEALSYGIPVLTTEPKVTTGVADSPAVVYCGSLAELVNEVEQLLSADNAALKRIKTLAREANQMPRQSVYQELLDLVAEA
jgi:glycosyltransferase involved in cell wall biosynthesis